MSAESSSEQRSELLDDFYAECDEHLGNVRAQAGRLEAALARGESDPAAAESLFRSVHSFKGNAGIVGLAAAEQVAHRAEEVLRRLTRGEAPLTAELLELIGEAGRQLEEIVAAFRLQQPLPDSQSLLARLAAVCPGLNSPAHPTPPASVAPDRAASDRLAFRATFSPSAERDLRGVNITSVRARLSPLGEIVKAVPNILPGGGMTFDFTLQLHAPPVDLAGWEADGIVFRPDDPAQPDGAAAEASPRHLPGSGSMFIAPSHIVRVDLGRLDDLMRIVGEMVIHRSRLEERIAGLGASGLAIHEVNLGLGRSLRELREAITRVRLVPVAEIFSRLPFVVRDLGRDNGKKVRLVLEGEDTEIDKYLVERLKEPLLHLVRNAVSHGIESPAERAAAGKPEESTVLLRAEARGDAVVIQISDDGGGIDPARVAQRAAAAGLPVPAVIDQAQLLALICTPGFSTREAVDRASGRGVGMAVVASTVRELGGSLALDSTPGRGTRFTLRLPLTLSIAETILVSAGGQTSAVPQGFIEEIIQVAAGEVRTVQRVEVVSYRGGLLPLIRLRTLFGSGPSDQPQLSVLVVASERGSAGLVVDRVHGQREVVVRPMRDPLIHVPGIAGATELGDGKPVLILDAVALTSGAVRPRPSAATLDAAPAETLERISS